MTIISDDDDDDDEKKLFQFFFYSSLVFDTNEPFRFDCRCRCWTKCQPSNLPWQFFNLVVWSFKEFNSNDRNRHLWLELMQDSKFSVRELVFLRIYDLVYWGHSQIEFHTVNEYMIWLDNHLRWLLWLWFEDEDDKRFELNWILFSLNQNSLERTKLVDSFSFIFMMWNK